MAISQEDAKIFDDALRKTAEEAIQKVGGPVALEVALKLFVVKFQDFCELLSAAKDFADNRGTDPILPLTPQVMEAYHLAIHASALVCMLMEMGAIKETD